MKTTRVQLPNGDLLQIEGADAEQVASIINNKLTCNVPVGNEGDEEPLLMAVMNFGKSPAKDSIQANEASDDEEAALVMPLTV